MNNFGINPLTGKPFFSDAVFNKPAPLPLPTKGELQRTHEAGRIFQGTGVQIRRTANGTRVHAKQQGEWKHPWLVEPYWSAKDDNTGEWRATVLPGFVNGRPAYIDMPDKWTDGAKAGPVRITNDPVPWLVLAGFNDPTASQGISMDADGNLVYGKGEGYPAFFDFLNVRLPAQGGASDDLPSDPSRTAAIRSIDVVLTIPRIGSALDITTLNPLVDNFTDQLTTTYSDTYYQAVSGRAKLTTSPEFKPLASQDINAGFLDLPMNSGDPQFDSYLVARVWMVSPLDGAGSDAVPDQTWTPYVQHGYGAVDGEGGGLFWNVNYATPHVPPLNAPPTPFKLNTGLGLGLLDYLGNALLAPINSGFDEAQTYLQQADLRGSLWTTL